MMRDRVADDEPAVVVHEDAQVQPLLPPLQEREDVRLPELVRRRPFEASRRVLALHPGSRRGDESLLVKDASNLALRDSQRLEAAEYVADPPRAPLRMFLLERHHAFPRKRRRCRRRTRPTALGLQRRESLLAKGSRPLHDRRRRHPEGASHVLVARPAQTLLHHEQLVVRRDIPRSAPFPLPPVRHAVSRSADGCQRFERRSAR
jgi:hypothetical protein